MHRLLLLACLLLCGGGLPGCGLLTREEPISFRTYTLENVSYDEGVDVVREALRRYAVGHFGGVGITEDPPNANLMLDPVIDGRRRMKFYVHFVERPPHLDVEMLALVDHLEAGTDGGSVGWVRKMMDVPLEEDVYRAAIQELLARRAAAPVP
jgi:hypothetical protein